MGQGIDGYSSVSLYEASKILKSTLEKKIFYTFFLFKSNIQGIN